MGDLSLRSAARWTTRALLLVLFNFISAAPMAVVSAQDSAVTSPAPTVASTDDTVPIFVKFRSGTAPSEIDAAMKTTGGLAVREHPQLRLHVLRVPAVAKEAILTGYKKHPAVEWAEAAHRVTQAGSPNDPLYAQQWALPKISWDKAYGVVPILGSAKIAVLDTGIDATHPDLLGRVSPGQSFVGGLPDIDSNGHGTAMAGIAAANVNNMIGIAGVAYAGASLSSVRVLGADGSGWDSDVVSGVLWAADNGAKVILMGFSSPDFSSSLQDAVNYAWSKGAVLVAATGNDGSTAPTYPAGMANVIGVAATNQNDAVAANSNTFSAAVAAPGVSIQATQRGGGYGAITGTSPSAAETAGLAALLVASGKSNGDAATQIRGTTDPVPGKTFGRINVYKALTTAATPQPTPLPTPTPTPGPTPTYRVGVSLNKDFRQCAENDQPPSTITGLGNCHWISNILQTTNSKYFEGMSVPQRTILINVPATTTPTPNGHTLTFHVSFTKGGKHGYDWLVSYDQAVSDAAANGITMALNPCGPEIGPPPSMATDCSTIRGGSNFITAAVPSDPFVSKDGSTSSRIAAYEALRGPRTIKIYGDAAFTGTATLTLVHDCGSNCVSGPGSDTADSDIDYTLTWTSASTKILIEMAGHLAVGGDGTGVSWGAGLGSSSISGGSYHFSLDLLDQGSLGNLDNQIQGAAIAAPTNGTIVVTKQVRGGNGSFSFDLSGPSTGSLTLSGGSTGATATLTGSFAGLANGTFTVSETVPSSFVPVGPTVCSTVLAGGNAMATCAFTNQAIARLTVSKQTNGGGGSFTFSAGGGIGTFTLVMPTGGVTTTAFTVSVPATVTVSEFASAGFSSSGGCNSNGSVTLTTPGASGGCAFTNQAVAAVTASGFMTGGGQVMNTTGQRASFGGNARGSTTDPCTLPSGCGHFNYDRTGLHLNGPVIQILSAVPVAGPPGPPGPNQTGQMTFCFQDKGGSIYTVHWRDVAEPGRGQDTIGLWSGCSPTPLLVEVTDNTPIKNGNIQWHPN